MEADCEEGDGFGGQEGDEEEEDDEDNFVNEQETGHGFSVLYEVEEANNSRNRDSYEQGSAEAPSRMQRDQLIKLVMGMLLCMNALLQDSADHVWQLYQEWESLCSIMITTLDGRSIRASPKIWRYDRPATFMERTLLQSYDDTMFKSRLRLSKPTFKYVCELLGPMLARQNTYMRDAIPVEKRVCIALSRLATGNCIKDIADTYQVGYTTAQRAIIEFCSAVQEKLHDLCIRWPSSTRMESIAKKFEALRGIPCVVGAIDGSHLPIVAPLENPQDYYNRKGFHSVLLQVIVDSECYIWDYDVGWAGSIHDWNLFQKSEAFRRVQAGFLGNYCLVGDAAYPARPWMLPPYKGHRAGLDRVQANWNYVQSATRMPVECTFGMLKARWRILLKRNDTILDNVPLIVSTCLVLHNLCIRHRDKFDSSWRTEAEAELRKSLEDQKVYEEFSHRVKRMRVPPSEVARIVAYGLHRVQGINLNPLEALARSLEEDQEEVEPVIQKTPKGAAQISAANQERRNAIALSMYDRANYKRVTDCFGVMEELHDSESD